MKRILVTGGAGYLGSVLVRYLLEHGYAVTVLDNFMFGQMSLLDVCHDERLRVVRGDARHEPTVRELLQEVDAVIPLAALVGAPLCDRDPVAAETTNAGAVELLCRLTSKEQRILLPVTNSGYGIGEKGKPCTEESPLRPISLYGRTKVKAEAAVLNRGNAVSFRLATVFGVSPRMRLDLLVNDFVYRAFRDRALIVFESHFKRNYIHIHDVARVFLHGLENFDRMKGNVYNVGLEEANLSKWELCQTIQKHIPGFVFMEAPIGEDPDKRDYIVSNEKLLATGFRTSKTLDDGIRELIKSFAILRETRFSNV
ncbi:MAG: NAD-dependent epimerase/dehydratase [Elusimicrobia bacterium]|nr:NAD-dependent epimerase/dehydratase [Elusimicrobiota bacterium]